MRDETSQLPPGGVGRAAAVAVPHVRTKPTSEVIGVVFDFVVQESAHATRGPTATSIHSDADMYEGYIGC